MSDTEDRHRFALDLVGEAGRLALQHFARLDSLATETKREGQDVVTEADRAVEDLIRAGIARAFPGDGVLGEERGHEPGTSGWTWVVDPIDGTSCFVSGLRDWCISVAAMREGEAQIGLILQPTTGDLYAAVRGAGAALNGRPIRVAEDARIGNRLLGFGANFRVPKESITGFAGVLLRAGGMFYRNGSGALMLAYVAAGRLAGYYEAHINAWDCMAGLLLIREAGGWTADFPGPERALEEGGPVLAGPYAVRDELIALVAASEAAP
jgi:myo-inositol-1(or 4)-monophosphatase